jgi:hypothetical protein
MEQAADAAQAVPRPAAAKPQAYAWISRHTFMSRGVTFREGEHIGFGLTPPRRYAATLPLKGRVASLVPERVDGVEARAAERREEAEDHTDGGGKRDRQDDDREARREGNGQGP